MRTILIVDDEVDLRDAIAFDFKRKNFNVVTASSGREAMKIIESQPVDIVLSDVRMADGDGVELLDWVKERNVFIPVVMFITGFADITLEEAYDKGAEAVFAKPFDRKVLMATVEKAILPIEKKFERKSGRVDIDLQVGLKVLKTGKIIQSRALNIGRGGMFAALGDILPRPGDEVEFQFGPLPEHNIPISGTGIIRWVRETGQVPGCGIEFTQLNQECSDRILQLINTAKTKAFIPLR